ncbi:unnamed protein product [Choristocarpus tenellus]
MLPSSVGGRYAPYRNGHSDSLSVSWSLPDYLRRIVDYHQMDLESTADQMVTLLTFNQKGV